MVLLGLCWRFYCLVGFILLITLWFEFVLLADCLVVDLVVVLRLRFVGLFLRIVCVDCHFSVCFWCVSIVILWLGSLSL